MNPPGLCVDQFGLAPLVSGQLCAGIVGPSPHDSCQGDSGGPLVRRDENGKFWLVGIVRSVRKEPYLLDDLNRKLI